MTTPAIVARPTAEVTRPQAGQSGLGRTARDASTATWATTVACAGLLLLLLGAAVGQPALVLLGTYASLAAGLRGRMTWDCSLPAATLLLLVVSVVAGVTTAWSSFDLVGHPLPLIAAQGAACVGAVVACRRRRAWRAARQDVRGAWVRHLPAGAAVLIGLAQVVVKDLAAGWSLLGTDIAQHVVLLGQVQAEGNLDYGAEGYPRGLHMLLALSRPLSQSSAGSAALLDQDVVLVSAAVWFSVAALLHAGGAVARAAGLVCGLPPRAAVVAAAVFSAALLFSLPFQQSFVHMGAAPSALAVLALWATPAVALLCHRGAARLDHVVVTAAVAALLLAHLWQALVLAPLVAALPALRRIVRPDDGGRASVRTLARVLAPGLVCIALAAPAVAGVLRVGGLDIAAIDGFEPGPPLVVVLAAVLVTVVTGARTDLPRRTWVATAGGLLLVTAVLLVSADGGLDLTQYYPQKAVWFFFLFSAPAVSVLVVATTLRLARVVAVSRLPSSTVRLLRTGGAAVAVTAALALVVPGVAADTSMLRAASSSGLDSAGARRLATAQEQSMRHAPATAVPVALGLVPGDPTGYVTSKLMRFRTGQPTNTGAVPDACADVRAVAGSDPAVVVTDLDPSALRPAMQRGGCADVPVVQAPGPRSAALRELEDLVREEG